MIAELFIEVNNRQAFVDFFIKLAHSLNSDMLERMPLISILGGPNSGKSLAAEIIIKGLDDHYNDQSIREQTPQQTFFLETFASHASMDTMIHQASVGGLQSTFYFASSEKPYNKARQHSSALENQRGLIVYGTHLEWCSFLASDLIIEIGEEEFDPNAPRVIHLEARKPHLRMCPVFQKFWRSLEGNALQWTDCELPNQAP